MGISTSPDKAKETRQKILDAAVNIFADKGYYDARVDEIVDASQTSKGAVYFHFPSKQEIFFSIIEQFVEILERNLLAAIAREEHGVQRVDVALRTCLETFQKYGSLAKIFLVQATGLGESFEAKQAEIHTRFARMIQKYLDQAVMEGDIAPIDTEVAAFIWMGAINDVVMRWVRTGEPEPERVIPTLHTMLLRSIGISEEKVKALD